MGNQQIRIGQLIAPFGPGSIYTDRQGVPQVVAGIDHWFMRWDQNKSKMDPCSEADREEFDIFEPRLYNLLKVNRFFSPPDHRHIRHGCQPPPNANLCIPALRFPRWYRHTKTGQLRRFNLDTIHIDKPKDGGKWQPVRFIAVCKAGHLCEFPWKQWIGCQCDGDGELFLTDRGGSELSSIKVECKSCPKDSSGHKGRNLAGTTTKPDIQNEKEKQGAFKKAGINCPGDRPWLGEGAAESGCDQPLVGAFINQTNLYFPRTISAITLPNIQPKDDVIALLRDKIEQTSKKLGIAKTLWEMDQFDPAIALIHNDLNIIGITNTPEQIKEALGSLFNSSVAILPKNAVAPSIQESEFLAFRRNEYNIIRNEFNHEKLRVISAGIPADLTTWFQKVNLIERLCETRVFYGFDRLEQNRQPLEGMPETSMRQLFRFPPKQPVKRWLPAIQVFGEGIYIELNEESLIQWQHDKKDWLQRRLDDGFIARLGGLFQTLPPLNAANRAWASRYLLVHSLAHILINQLVFECGYSTASLRERLYVSADNAAPMAAMLIYTSAGDSEGTLGGLVRLGHPERLGLVIERALSRASWCSADPICSEHNGGQGARRTNLAACHACTLLPETSCETINQGLDRAMIVGTPDNPIAGFMSALIERDPYV